MTTPLTPGAAKKSLGQHFLFDPSLLKRVANAGGAVEGKTVIEVGPGPGGLTRALLDSSAMLKAPKEETRRRIVLIPRARNSCRSDGHLPRI